MSPSLWITPVTDQHTNDPPSDSLRVIVPPSRYPVTIHLVGRVTSIEHAGLTEFCPTDISIVRVELDIVKVASE
jgi:hypothetical protein